MYKLREGITWEDIKVAYIHSGRVYFDYYFEKVDLPVVKFENKINMIEREINNKWCVVVRDRYIEVGKSFNGGLDYIIILIGKDYDIKSVSEFNEKCALLFGFYLKEAI